MWWNKDKKPHQVRNILRMLDRLNNKVVALEAKVYVLTNELEEFRKKNDSQ